MFFRLLLFIIIFLMGETFLMAVYFPKEFKSVWPRSQEKKEK